jgi:UDP-N-acetylglucosamine:LPS N-acetylglucosamine transferase
MVVLADNQEASAKAMQKIDAANCIGQAAALRDELPAKLEILSKSPLTLKSMTVSSAAICDGSGAPHVAKIFLNIMGE